ncbi:hypothetical protein ACWEGQ_20090 [Streptomyces seoulensis]
MSGSRGGGDAEARFLDPANRLAQECTPDAPAAAGPVAPDPRTLPGAPTDSPAYGPGRTPPGTPDAAGDIPVPVEDAASSAPGRPGAPGAVHEVPLSDVEACSGARHAERSTRTFEDKGPTGNLDDAG